VANLKRACFVELEIAAVQIGAAARPAMMLRFNLREL
jgi:hypothetical protein